MIEQNENGVFNNLFALRTEKGADEKSAFENPTGRKRNTIKSTMIENCILEEDPIIVKEIKDFSD